MPSDSTPSALNDTATFEISAAELAGTLPFKVQRNRKSTAQNLFQYLALFQSVVVNQHVIQALRDFNFRRENEVREEKLDARSIFHRKIGGRNPHQTSRLSRPRIASHVERNTSRRRSRTVGNHGTPLIYNAHEMALPPKPTG